MLSLFLRLRLLGRFRVLILALLGTEARAARSLINELLGYPEPKPCRRWLR